MMSPATLSAWWEPTSRLTWNRQSLGMVSAVHSARRLRGLALKFFPVSAYRFGNIVDRGSGTRCSFFIFMRSAATVHTWFDPDIA